LRSKQAKMMPFQVMVLIIKIPVFCTGILRFLKTGFYKRQCLLYGILAIVKLREQPLGRCTIRHLLV